MAFTISVVPQRLSLRTNTRHISSRRSRHAVGVAGTRRRYTVQASTPTPAVQAGVPLLELELADDTRLAFRVSPPAVNDLAKALNGLIISFRAISSGDKTKATPLDFQCEDGALRLQVECNPNLFANAFSATAYVVVDDGRMRLSATAELPKLVDNVQAYKKRMA